MRSDILAACLVASATLMAGDSIGHYAEGGIENSIVDFALALYSKTCMQLGVES